MKHVNNSDVPTAQWKKAAQRAKITRERNNALRASKLGRLLLVLQHCSEMSRRGPETNIRRLEMLLGELHYACRLADEAGVNHGWLEDEFESYLLVFELSGDIVFRTYGYRVKAPLFPRQAVACDSDTVIKRDINTLLRRTRMISQSR